MDEAEIRRFVEATARKAYWDGWGEYAYPLYFIMFAIGAMLLVAYVFIPKRDYSDSSSTRVPLARYRSVFGTLGAALLLILLAISQQASVDQSRGFVADQDRRNEAIYKRMVAQGRKDEALQAQYLYMPEGNSLAYMSLGNTSLAADYVWLTSTQYVSNSFRRGQKFSLLLRFYNTVMDLDPHWVEAGINGGKVLSALEQDRDKVEQFYFKVNRENPESWTLAYEGGRLYVFPALNPQLNKVYSERAVWWFERALARLTVREKTLDPDGKLEIFRKKKIELRDLIARLGVEANAYELADRMLLENALDKEQSDAFRLLSAREWLYARSLLLVSRLQRHVDQYKKRNGYHPPAIVRTQEPYGFARPYDAYGFMLEYDPIAGKVWSRGVAARRAYQAAVMIHGLIDTFRIENQRLPKDLGELHSFIRYFYSSPANQVPSLVTESLGAELNTEISPFGTPWQYDPQKGTIELPPECDLNKLYAEADKLLLE